MDKRTIIIVLVILAVSVIIPISAAVWLLYGWKIVPADLYYTCKDGYSVYQRDPGAWSSYIYELHDEKGHIVEDNLRTRHLRDIDNEHDCTLIDKYQGG